MVARGYSRPAVFAVEPVTDANAEIAQAIGRLLPLLSSSAPTPSVEDLEEMVSSPATTVFVARDGGERGPIVGTLTLAVFRIPSGLRAWIEDVIVAEEARGRGCGEALTEAALELAKAKGARTVDLTSRPSREAANRLYQRLGFKRRETNLYRYDLQGAR
jgi:ribosomal protein S18 acetylase RimI-like enzyme